ncbi:hypothetical protein INR49_015572 [Caranx melampygus]|nr:hypothetical protein INR49_015572 [Caranx melampygus]
MLIVAGKQCWGPPIWIRSYQTLTDNIRAQVDKRGRIQEGKRRRRCFHWKRRRPNHKRGICGRQGSQQSQKSPGEHAGPEDAPRLRSQGSKLMLNITYLRLKNIKALEGLVVHKRAPDVWLCRRVGGLGSGDG